MALGSHLITVRRLEKYINDVIGKKANLPDTSKTIIGNISQINSDLSLSEDEITFINNWGGSAGELKERNNIFSFWFRYQTGLSTDFTTGIIASLPSGFRPSTIKYLPCVKLASNGLTPNGRGFVVVNTNGDITYYGDAFAFQEYVVASGEFIN